MRRPDLISTIAAGLFGAALTYLIVKAIMAQVPDAEGSPWPLLIGGFFVGAGVQMGVRISGVS